MRCSSAVRRHGTLLTVALALLPARADAQSHPFLIVRPADLPALEARAALSPWKEMAAAGIADCKSLSYQTSVDRTQRVMLMKSVVSACTLAYLADPVGRPSHRDKLKITFDGWDDLYALRFAAWSDWHPYVVGTGNALFYSLLSLDILWNDLTPAERVTIEAKLGAMAEWYWSLLGYPFYVWWPLNMWATRGIWALYKGDRPRLDEAKKGYRAQLGLDFGADGVYREGPGYAWSRLATDPDRDSKAHFMDVLEHTGEDKYYGDPAVARFYEWLLTGGVSSVRHATLFGDTHHLKRLDTWRTARLFTLERFSSRAAAQAAWLLRGGQPSGSDLLAYVLVEKPLPAPLKPSSGLWPDGGAALWDADPDDGSLMAVLWNRKDQYDHSHKEVNAVYLAGYGEHLLVNSGYAGWGQGCAGASWAYANSCALSGNTVTVDGVDHVSKSGAGLVEGILGLGVDYASARSGSALPSGAHERSLVLVHTKDARPGYAVLFDEVKPSSAAAQQARLTLHPLSAEATVVTDRFEYRWRVSRLGGSDVFITIVLGTEPVAATLEDGAICTTSATGGSFLGKVLAASYPLGAGQRGNAVTVLFPSDSTHPKASFKRITGAAFSGASIDLGGGVLDVAVEADGQSAVNVDGVTVTGRAALFRRQAASCSFFLLRQGRAYSCGASGVSALAPVSLLLKGSSGRIVSGGTRVIFRQPGVGRLELDGKAWPVQQTGEDEISAEIPAGSHDLILGAGTAVDRSADRPLLDARLPATVDRSGLDSAGPSGEPGTPPSAGCSCQVFSGRDSRGASLLLLLLFGLGASCLVRLVSFSRSHVPSSRNRAKVG